MNSKPLIYAGTYEHFKGGIYKVIGIAKNSETLEDMVVYRTMKDEHQLWVRPLTMFKEKIEIDGKKIPRFKKINDQ
ncbi:DUF1653 domain-containing protein [Candidatus Peregrinibacteria bacterium]|nr:DUF1653 domain-containing protein [Candidatus Peregrinibacteria bacterium]